MAVRRPLYYDSGNLRQMTDEQIAQVRARMFWSYVSNPSVTLTVVNSGGNLGTLTDTRLQAGEVSTSASSTPTEAETAEPSIVNVAISRIQQTIASDPNPATTPTQYPAYYTLDGNVRAMNLQDMYDTFAIQVFNGGWVGPDGSTIYPSLVKAYIYVISTSTSLSGPLEIPGPDDSTIITSMSGYTAVPGPDGSTIIPVFSDTRADVAAYDVGNIPEDQDQPTTVQDYYLLKKDVTEDLPMLPAMVRVNNDGNVVAMTNEAIDTAIGAAIRYMVQAETGRKIRYEYGVNGSGTGDTAGSAMTDSRLDGSGNYQTLYVGADDYRAQEFPDGSQQVINVYTLKARVD
jgi:hypothetical protein